MRDLYPEIEPLETGMLDVGDRQHIYWEVSGNLEGKPVVFLHGNPTSSYLWRNVIPRLRGHGRVIAPDLVGHGDSPKLPGTGDDRYSLAEHQAYLDALLDELDVREDVVLVGHDWGGPLAFDWARRHPDAVSGIAYLETIDAKALDGAEDRTVELNFGPDNRHVFRGDDYLFGFALPNFYFHVAIAHGILRSQGVPVGKMDFIGAPPR